MRFCPYCGAPQEADSRYCSRCGRSLAAPDAAPPHISSYRSVYHPLVNRAAARKHAVIAILLLILAIILDFASYLTNSLPFGISILPYLEWLWLEILIPYIIATILPVVTICSISIATAKTAKTIKICAIVFLSLQVLGSVGIVCSQILYPLTDSSLAGIPEAIFQYIPGTYLFSFLFQLLTTGSLPVILRGLLRFSAALSFCGSTIFCITAASKMQAS